jgi:Na+/melibiose symporter-like transporter
VVRRVLTNTAGIILAFVLLLVLSIFLTSFGVQWTVMGALAAAILVAVAWLMADSLRRLHERVDSVFTASLGGKGPGRKAARALRKEMADMNRPGRPPGVV